MNGSLAANHDRTGKSGDASIEEQGITLFWNNRAASEQAARAAHARQRSQRRRLVEPATSERAYSAAEVEFMNAMQRYKQQSGRMFPTWSEVLEVLASLGYSKLHGQAEATTPNG